jgi:hypothetical protein
MQVVANNFEAVGNRIVGHCGTVTVTDDRFHAVLGAKMLNADESLQEIVETVLKELDGPIPIESWEPFLARWERRIKV